MERTRLEEIRRSKASYLFVLAPFALFIVFVVGPVIASFFLSFTEYNGISAPKFIGLAHYAHILSGSDKRFMKALLNVVIYVAGVVPAGILLASIIAVMIDQRIRLKTFFKGVLFLPTVTSIVATSVMWRWLYAGSKYGLINHFILMKLGLEPIDWLMSPRWILPAIMIMSIWTGLGYNVILFLAGLQTIPSVMYEAAEVDGAGFWHKFFNITLPLLKPTMVFVTIMSCIFSFQVFEQVYIMTTAGGGPIGGVLDSALTPVPYLYDVAFHRFEMGYASALAYVLFAVVLALTLINKRFMAARVDY